MKPITFLQWNILYTEDVNNIIRLLKETKPDIFALQELTRGFKEHAGENIPEIIAKALGYNYYVKMSADPAKPSSGEMGSGIFTHFPIESSDFKWINEYNESVEPGYDNQYKPYVEVDVRIGSSILTLGTTHMSYTHRFINYPRKRQEVDKLLQIIDKKSSNYVFSGDLNSRPGSYAVRNIAKRLKHAGPKPEDKTWTTKPFSYRGFKETELNWRLDYVFATGDIKIVSSEVLDTKFSDHLPILTKIMLID